MNSSLMGGGSSGGGVTGANTSANSSQQQRSSVPHPQHPPSYFQNRFPYGLNASPESAISPSISSVATSTSEVSSTKFTCIILLLLYKTIYVHHTLDLVRILQMKMQNTSVRITCDVYLYKCCLCYSTKPVIFEGPVTITNLIYMRGMMKHTLVEAAVIDFFLHIVLFIIRSMRVAQLFN